MCFAHTNTQRSISAFLLLSDSLELLILFYLPSRPCATMTGHLEKEKIILLISVVSEKNDTL